MSAFDLDRFVAAQNRDGTYERALGELRAGHKRSHWMWFVLPQLEGLGRSATALRYGIRSLDEARAYLGHPLLGARLRTCAEALLSHRERTAAAILGQVDALKLRSSATLFARAEPAEPLFPDLLDRFYGGAPDAATDELLRAPSTKNV